MEFIKKVLFTFDDIEKEKLFVMYLILIAFCYAVGFFYVSSFVAGYTLAKFFIFPSIPRKMQESEVYCEQEKIESIGETCQEDTEDILLRDESEEPIALVSMPKKQRPKINRMEFSDPNF